MRLIPLLTLLLPALPAAAQVARVEVQPDRATLIAGNQLALRVVVLDAGGRPIEGGPVRWSATSADAIVVDSAGVVTAFRDGVARVTATVGGVSGTAEFLVEPRGPARIEVVPEQPEIVVGGSTLLRAVARTGDGAPLPRAAFTFRSSDDRVATVDPSGVVTGRGEGSAIFAVQTGEVRSEVRVTVVNNRVGRLTVNGPVQARAGDVVRFRASAEDRRNLPVANPAVRWAVSGEGADVGHDGAFVAERPGTYLVTVVAGNVAGVHAIRVTPRGAPPGTAAASPPPRAAVPAGVHPSLRGARSVWVEDTLAYIPDSAGALRVFSLGNPAMPRELGGWQMASTAGPGVPPMPRTIHDVMVKDGLAYLAFGRDGLAVLDVGQGGRGGSAAMPRLVSLLVPLPPADATPEAPSVARAVLRHGRYVYLADGAVTGRVLVLEMANPLEPAVVAEIRLADGGPVRLWATEETLYVEAGGKIRAVDVRGELRGDLVGQGR